MEELLTTSALAFPALTAAVGEAVSWKVRQGLPAVVFHRIFAERTYTQKGRVPTTVYLLQVDGWGRTDAEAGAVKLALVAWFDTLTTRPLQAFLQGDPPDHWEPAEGADAQGSTAFYRQSVQVRLVHQENP